MKSELEKPPLFSLIVATVDRTQELARLLASIDLEQADWIQLIVVDQNDDDRVQALLEQEAPTRNWVHIRAPRGLSRARNAGLTAATGFIVGFPDDDCWYPPQLLPRLRRWFERHPGEDVLCCMLRDEAGRELLSRWPAFSQPLDRHSALRAAVSASLFVRGDAARHGSGFDEHIGLGAGTPFGSGEDTDYVLKLLAAGKRGWFERDLHVCHPSRRPHQVAASRAKDYGMGFGYLLRKHGYSPASVLYHVGRALAGCVLSTLLLRRRAAAFYLQSAAGRWQGYVESGERMRSSASQSIR